MLVKWDRYLEHHLVVTAANDNEDLSLDLDISLVELWGLINEL